MTAPKDPAQNIAQSPTHLVHLEQRKQSGARLYSPTAGRNKGPIAQALAQHLPPNARVLEIASGTGEHGVAVCAARRDIIWMPSEIDTESRRSITDWACETNGQMHMPLALDMQNPDWPLDGSKTVLKADAIYNANMLHIAPIEAASGLAQGAARVLGEAGMLILYGPFLFAEKSAQSNLDFNERLKARNVLWGVRELELVKDIFAESSLALRETLAMPANNHCLIFTRRS